MGSNEFSYWFLIFKQTEAIYHYEEDLKLWERKYFYELMLESIEEMDKINNGYE